MLHPWLCWSLRHLLIPMLVNKRFSVYMAVLSIPVILSITNERYTAERLGQLYAMLGKEQIQLETAHAGDIVVVAKMSEALTNDTLM